MRSPGICPQLPACMHCAPSGATQRDFSMQAQNAGVQRQLKMQSSRVLQRARSPFQQEKPGCTCLSASLSNSRTRMPTLSVQITADTNNQFTAAICGQLLAPQISCSSLGQSFVPPHAPRYRQWRTPTPPHIDQQVLLSGRGSPRTSWVRRWPAASQDCSALAVLHPANSPYCRRHPGGIPAMMRGCCIWRSW